jgi:hypothetical protein
MRVEEFSTQLQAKGDVDLIIDYKNGEQETKYIRNTILRNGRRSLAKALANQIGAEFDFYITRMLFGDGGTNEGVKKYVNADRNGLFGVTRISKPVLATIDPTIPTQAIFTTVITFDEGVGVVLSEMALQMANGDLYSMTTFPDLTKTEEMQITFNWRLNFV